MFQPRTPIPQSRETLPPAPERPRIDDLMRGPVAILGAILILAAITLGLQGASGAWLSEFGGHPDEAAHYVTSLMMRDYVFGGGLPGNPLAFAENYYAHYPRIALGHYPPVFYLLAAPWLAVFGTSAASTMVFMAAQSTAFALSAFLMARRRYDYLTAILAGAGVALLPLTQRYTSLVMSDLALALACLGSAWAFGRFLATGKLRWSLLFAVLASTATLVKGSGLMMALVVPLAIVLAWRWDVLLNWRLWVAPPLVVLLVAPWTIKTYAISKEGMMKWTPDYPLTSALSLGGDLPQELGWGILLAALIGLGFILRPLFRPRVAEGERRGLAPDDAAMVAFPFALLAFYILVPSGFDERYVLPVVPAALVLAAWGIHGLAGILTPRGSREMRPVAIAGALFAVVAIAFFAVIFRVPDKNFHGFRKAAQLVYQDLESARKKQPQVSREILVSSDSYGEGAFIAELAQLDQKRPSYIVQRSSKMVASSDWIGRDYKVAFDTPEALAAGLRASTVNWVVRDEQSIPVTKQEPHHKLLGQAMDLLPKGSAAGIPPSGFVLAQQPLSISRASTKPPLPLLLYRRDTPAARPEKK
jgi:hypothetical protein